MVWGYDGGSVAMVVVAGDGVFFLAIPDGPSADIDWGVGGVVEFDPFMIMVVFSWLVHYFVYENGGVVVGGGTATKN